MTPTQTPTAHEPAPLMLSVSGCRGIVGASLTPETAARFAGAFAGWLAARSGGRAPAVVFGRDGRAGAEGVRLGALAGLVGAGCRVVDLGVATTPTIGLMVDRVKAAGGVALTASHNPAEWNGLKGLVASPRGAHAPTAGDAADIIARFREGRIAHARHDAVGVLENEPGAAALHVERALRAIEAVVPVARIRERRFRVVVDSVNCSGAEAARLLCDALGCDLTHLHADGSGRFPHTPEPTRENLGGLCDAVRERGAAAGFAQDPDADRLAIIDERGTYIGEECTLVLAAMALLRRGAVAAANLSTSRMIDDVAASVGARVVRTPVGEANVVEAMLREGSAIGGEGNGGVIWPEVCLVRDSVSAIALTLALMAREGAPLSALVARTPAYVIEKRKAPVRPGLAEQAARAIARRWAAERVDLQDGVRVDFGVGGEDAAWLHVRASNTEPIMRLIAEARSAARAGAILDEAAGVIAGL